MAKQIKADKLNKDSKFKGNGDLFITVFTDASYCPSTKAYGCATWVRDGTKPAFKTVWGGVGLKGSFDAELEALNRAVSAVFSNCEVLGRVVVIQSDCIAALDRVGLRKLRKYAKHVKLKHVKAHTGGQTKRSYVNDWCDKAAYEEMVKHRTEVNMKMVGKYV